MKERLLRLSGELGPLGRASLLLLAAVAAFHFMVLKPMQARGVLLEERVARQAPRGETAAPAGSVENVNAVYEFLRKDEQTTDWLAKLHGIGAATGVNLRSASYRSQQTGPILRYEIVVPVAGSYAQIREFLTRSLAEIPVLSIDQLTLRRESRNDGTLQAELRMTLHMVKS